MAVYKDDKRGTWYCAFYYRTWTGERKHTCKRGFPTRAAAKKYETEFMNALSQNPDITFGNLVTEYLKDLSSRLKPSTMETKRSIIETYLLPYFESLPIGEIDALKIRKWQNEMLSKLSRSGRPLSETYLRTIHAQLSAILNYAVNNYGLGRNPCYQTGPIGSAKADEKEIWTLEEFNTFLEHCKKTPFRLAFEILYYTGIREGELLALYPSDILDDCRISITKNFAVIKNVEYILTPKTRKSERTFSIPQFLYDEIQTFLAARPYIGSEDRIFYFRKNTLINEFKKITKDAGLSPIRVHDLRHSHVSLLASMNIPITVVSERVGHESSRVTMEIYSHVYGNQDAQVADQLDDLHNNHESTDDSVQGEVG